MSHDYSAIKNKQQKQSKVYFEQYLYNSGEPMDDSSRDTPPELEARMEENSYDMRQRFRHIAQRLRNRHI